MPPRDLPIKRSVGIAILSSVLLASITGFRPAAEAQSTGSLTLTVHVTGARNAKGQIRAALFQSAKGFPGDVTRAVQAQAANIDPGTLNAQIVFSGLPDGVYAVSVFHDENMNQKFDKNFMGIPKEGYGASNNPRRKMGPPDFEEAKFRLSGQAQPLEIKLMY